jgi:ferredoxin/nitrate reductase gamma subunit
MDLKFVRELGKLGGESVGICVQCGTCTATCPLSSAVKGFPRRTIRHIQLGLRESALKDMDMWLCASCRTCNASCPRGASPGEVMSALTRYASSRYSMKSGGSWLLRPGAKAVAALVLLATLFTAAIAMVATIPTGAMDLGAFLPFKYIDYAGMAVGVVVAVGLIIAFSNMWKRIRAEASIGIKVMKMPGLLGAGLKTIYKEVVLQTSQRQCERNLYGASSHLMVVSGMIGAAVTTTIIFVTNPTGGPPALFDPVKIVGNVSAFLLILGTSMMLAKRFTGKGREFRYYFYDWLFLSLIFTAAISGLMTEVLRLMDVALPGYIVYSFHLVVVSLLLITAPFTKFAHPMYRLMTSWVSNVKGWKEKDREVMEI